MAKKKALTPAEREQERANLVRRYKAQLLMYTDGDTNEIDIVRFVRDTLFRLEVIKRSLWKLVVSTNNARQQLRALNEIYALSVKLSEAYEYYDTIRPQSETREKLDLQTEELIKKIIGAPDKEAPSPDDSDKS